MSSSHIPKATRSRITNLTVTPNFWDSHPIIERSHVETCAFLNLNSSTVIERSRLSAVRLSSAGIGTAGLLPTGKPSSSSRGKSVIERSMLKASDVQQVHIERSNVGRSTLSQCKIERSELDRCMIVGPKARGNHSKMELCEMRGESEVNRSTTKQVDLDTVKVNRSTLNKVRMKESKVGRTTLKDCVVEGCKMERSTFKGMYLRNGIWERGDLVGRVNKTQEVTVRPLTEEEQWKDEEMEYTSAPPYRVVDSTSRAAQIPVQSKWEEAVGYSFNEKTPTSSVYSSLVSLPDEHPMTDGKSFLSTEYAGSLLDQPGAFPYFMDDYEGPELESPPAYDS